MPYTTASVCVLFVLLAGAIPCSFGQDAASKLPGTKPLTIEAPLDEVMVDGIRRFALRALQESPRVRADHWSRDFSTRAAYAKSIAPNRARFRAFIGAVDERVPPDGFHLVARLGHDGVVARSPSMVISAVRWPVLPGVSGEGLLLESREPAVARVVALPDADWSPESFAAVETGLGEHLPIAQHLAARRVQVIVPTLISRSDSYSGDPAVGYTNQPHREFVYRQSFELGRHIIGYEVQKVEAAVDLLERMNHEQQVDLPIGVVGVGEGGLLAFYASAVDPRIDATMVSGYFQPREGLWQEPIYRNVWGLLSEFGDAEIASLIAPRPLVIEACAAPETESPLPPRDGRLGGAAPGKIEPIPLADARSEFDRAQSYYNRLKCPDAISLVASGDGSGPSGSTEALASFLAYLGIQSPRTVALGPLESDGAWRIDAASRQRRQLEELVDHTQRLMRQSQRRREEFWSRADRTSVESWTRSSKFYRDYVWDEMIGRLPSPTIPPNVRTRRVLAGAPFHAYEVVIDVYPDVIAAGILLLPKSLRPDEKRPVVVCQHGLEGLAIDTISGSGNAYSHYKSFAAELCKQGFIVYAPQNPYRGKDRFRVLQRMSNPLKRSLFSYVIRQHERTIEWLRTLPNVDPKRIAFYGLSYGGKTAMRVPPLLDDMYALCICSADFNDWIRKIASVDDRYSYMYTGEYEMPEWNMGHVASYAELAALMAPRPFMVERGHDDGVAPDEWVAAEYAKVRRHYDQLGLADRTEIEFFNGPHTINGVGTFRFLRKHLDWPATAAR